MIFRKIGDFMATEKINFNISPTLKRDIERLANSYGKNLSAFMIDVCNILVKNNAARIKEQAAREKEPINFGGNVTTKKNKSKKTDKPAIKKSSTQSNSKVIGVDDNG